MAECFDIPASVVRERINEIRVELQRADQARAELRALESLFIKVHASLSDKTKRFGPRRAIRLLLQQNPRSQSDVVDALTDRVVTRSRNARRTLQTTIGQMLKEGRIVEQDGLVSLVEA